MNQEKQRPDEVAAALAEPANETAQQGPTPASAVERDQGPSAEELGKLLQEAEAEIARLKDERLRALAEVENTRRRAARDKQEASQYAITAFARDVLSVADNLQRAIATVSAEAREQDPQLAALTGGVEMTEKELLSVLQRHGVQPLAALGAPFDPHLHEAMFEIPDASVAHGTVLQVLQPGYTIHDRTLRPARVAVARGGAKPTMNQNGPGSVSDNGAVNQGPAQQAYGGVRGGTTGARVDERS